MAGGLERAVSAVVNDCLGVAEGEEVLVVCNPATQALGEAMHDEAATAGAEAVLAVMTERALRSMTASYCSSVISA